MTSKELAPLQNVLDTIIKRLNGLEAKVGISPTNISDITANGVSNGATNEDESEISPALEAYDTHMSNAAQPFINSINAIDGLSEIGSCIQEIWMGMRTCVQVGSTCKKPSNIQTALQPYLKPIQDGIGKIRSARLDRKFD